ncbi:MAG TPA: hypothetical protein VKZ63_16185 [Kofleriaceae bacterium]|nr:hypothetical protein [Kofleriaceae bacterium]
MKRAAWILLCVLSLAAPPALAGRGGSRGKPRKASPQQVQQGAPAQRVPPPGQRGGRGALGQTRRQATDTGARAQRTEQGAARRGTRPVNATRGAEVRAQQRRARARGQKRRARTVARAESGTAARAINTRALDPSLGGGGGRRPGRIRTFFAATAVAVVTLLGVATWQSFDIGSRALELFDSARNQIEQTIDGVGGGGSGSGSGGGSGPSAPAPTPPDPAPQPESPQPPPPPSEEGPARPVGGTLRPGGETGVPTIEDR